MPALSFFEGQRWRVRSFEKARSLIGRAVSFRHFPMLSTRIQANGELVFLMKTFGGDALDRRYILTLRSSMRS